MAYKNKYGDSTSQHWAKITFKSTKYKTKVLLLNLLMIMTIIIGYRFQLYKADIVDKATTGAVSVRNTLVPICHGIKPTLFACLHSSLLKPPSGPISILI